MDFERFVRVTPNGDLNRGGTGYLLTGNRVLTARHVVRSAAPLAVYFSGSDGSTVRTESVEILWRGEDALDVAILGVETGREWPRCTMDGEAISQEAAWSSRGWTRTAANAGPLPVDSMEPLAGTVYAVTKSATHLTLGVSNPPAGAEWWKGTSGAPVFCGSRLIAVIRGGPTSFGGGRLRATPLSALWNDPEFRLQAGCAGATAEREKRHRALFAKIAAKLEALPRTAAPLAEHGPEAWKKAQRAGAAAFAAALCETESWTEAVEAFDRAQKAALAAGAVGLADALLDLLLMVIPEIHFRDLAYQGDGGQLLSLSLQTETQTEIFLAAHDGRRLCFKAVEELGEYPDGVGLVPLKVPAQDPPQKEPFLGWNLEQERSVEAWIPLLAQWVRISKRDRDRLAGDVPALAERVSDHLDDEVERDATEYPRRYLALPAKVIANSGEFIAELRRLVPGLHVASLESGTSLNQERREFRRVQAMLHDFEKRKRGSS